MNLFTAAEARDHALHRVDANAPDDWKTAAMEAIHRIAKYGHEFTTDDIWAMVQHPPEPRALGAMMVKAQRAGWIRPTDRVRNSIRVECHARPVRIWVGCL